MINKVKNWLWFIDVEINYYLLNGNRFETISSRLGRLIKRDDCKVCTLFAKVLCRIVLAPLAWILGQGTHHCTKSIQPGFKK